MRVFIYVTKIVSTSRKYGYNKVEAKIYEVINNIPCPVLKIDNYGEPCGAVTATWQTNSHRGESSEVYQVLSQFNIIPQVPINEYYFPSNKDIKIIQI